MDLTKYNSQIKELISLRHEPDFNTLLDKILFGESNSHKFLIKMELNRLTTPCKRVIDLRDKVLTECSPYDIENIKHYLTIEALAIFKSNLERYGEYTIGVFEAVHQYISEKKQFELNASTQVINSDTKSSIELLTLINNRKRATPRMYLVSMVNITLSDGKSLQAQTANISTTGLKIKLTHYVPLRNEELVEVMFTDLRHSFHEPVLNSAIKYKIIKQKEKESKFYLYLTLSDNNDDFNQFLKHFIRTHHYKYKFDVHYYYQLVKIDALKISYFKQLNALPIYLNCNEYSPILFALKNHVNNNILQDWFCDGVNQLEFLFNELRFTQLCVYAQTRPATTLYSFTHQVQGKIFFISATEEELQHSGLKTQFLHYGSRKESWRTYHFTLQPYQYLENNHYPQTDLFPQQFKNITHLATLLPLNDSTITYNQQIDTKDINKINCFVHRINKIKGFDIVEMFTEERRIEPRYLFSCKVFAVLEGKKHSGTLIDFSLTGLRIKLDNNIDINVNHKLTVNLFELQKIATNYSLENLKYKVVHLSPENTLHLQVNDKASSLTTKNFFSLLVENNKDKLKCLPLNEKRTPSQKRLLELSESFLNNAILFIHNEKNLPIIKYAAINHVKSPISKLLNRRNGKQSLLQELLLDNDYLYERLITKPVKENDSSNDCMVYIKAYERTASGKVSVCSSLILILHRKGYSLSNQQAINTTFMPSTIT
ncbi:PilZ domain-containing protein [Psychromonas sp. MME1]|uniref:PilZ domain-containing protein n=1 Tax=Psychromonas sp. MME1 TaxID=3231032 RepID=UPI0034E257EC